MDPRTTRGYANNNPGNMDRGEPPWNGEVRDVSQTENDIQRYELTSGRFCVFKDPQHGIRAMALNLKAYHDRLGCRSIRDYINRWAPPNENNTEAYIQNVARSADAGTEDRIDITSRKVLHAIIDGIIRVECAGMPYAGTEIEDGITMAGFAKEGADA